MVNSLTPVKCRMSRCVQYDYKHHVTFRIPLQAVFNNMTYLSLDITVRMQWNVTLSILLYRHLRVT